MCKYLGKEVDKNLVRKIILRKHLTKQLQKHKSLLYMFDIIKRPSVSINKFQVFMRDNFTCQYCGRTPQDGIKLVLDHIKPLKRGGKNKMENSITSCKECNTLKNKSMLR